MSLILTEVSPNIWVNQGDGNIDCIHLDGPLIPGREKQAVIRFASGFSKLMPTDVPIKRVIAILTNQASINGDLDIWDCEYGTEELSDNLCKVHDMISSWSFEFGPHRPCVNYYLRGTD